MGIYTNVAEKQGAEVSRLENSSLEGQDVETSYLENASVDGLTQMTFNDNDYSAPYTCGNNNSVQLDYLTSFNHSGSINITALLDASLTFGLPSSALSSMIDSVGPPLPHVKVKTPPRQTRSFGIAKDSPIKEHKSRTGEYYATDAGNAAPEFSLPLTSPFSNPDFLQVDNTALLPDYPNNFSVPLNAIFELPAERHLVPESSFLNHEKEFFSSEQCLLKSTDLEYNSSTENQAVRTILECNQELLSHSLNVPSSYSSSSTSSSSSFSSSLPQPGDFASRIVCLRLPSSQLREISSRENNIDNKSCKEKKSIVSNVESNMSLKRKPRRCRNGFNSKRLKKEKDQTYIASVKTPNFSANKRGSFSCWTCKLRRKRCDGQHPICRSCIRLGIPCFGFEAERPDFMKDPVKNHEMREKFKKSHRGGAKRFQKSST